MLKVYRMNVLFPLTPSLIKSMFCTIGLTLTIMEGPFSSISRYWYLPCYLASIVYLTFPFDSYITHITEYAIFFTPMHYMFFFDGVSILNLVYGHIFNYISLLYWAISIFNCFIFAPIPLLKPHPIAASGTTHSLHGLNYIIWIMFERDYTFDGFPKLWNILFVVVQLWLPRRLAYYRSMAFVISFFAVYTTHNT